MTASLPAAVFDAWLRGRGPLEVVPVGGGLSGALVFAVGTAGDPRWAVRGWPLATPPQRVSEIHRVMRTALERGCTWIPRLEVPAGAAASWIVAEGRVWDCGHWMPGTQPTPQADPLVLMRETAAAVARFHGAVADLASEHGPVPAVTSRLLRLEQLQREIPRLFGSVPVAGNGAELAGAIHRAVACLRQVWEKRFPAAVAALRAWADIPLRQQYVFRDIHLGNTLFEAGRLTAIVDLDAVRVDCPATDLARLIGSVQMLTSPQQWEQTGELLWAELLGTYRAAMPLSASEEQLARTLSAVNPLVVAANWVVWVVLEQRSFPGSPRRIAERIDAWTRVLQHQAEELGGRFSVNIETR